MPIVARHITEARRAAAHAAELAKAAELARTAELAGSPEQARVSANVPSPRPRTRAVQPALDPASPINPAEVEPEGEPPDARQPDEAARGDYEVGYGKPPVHTRFTKGCKGGPGRPKGSVSHDTLIKRQLDQKQRVRINGREKKVSMRELIVTKAVLAAVEGKDRDARKFVLAESARLYSAANDADVLPDSTALNASDALSIEEYLSDMRREIRLELERELGMPNAGDPE